MIPPAQSARGIQVIARIDVARGEIFQVRKIQAQPFQDAGQGTINFLNQPAWWQVGAAWGAGETVPYWRWAIYAQQNDQAGAPLAIAPGDFIALPVTVRDPLEVLAGVAELLLPPSEITVAEGSHHLPPARINVQGCRAVILLCMWDQTARIAHTLPLLGQPYGRIEGEHMPEVLLTPSATQLSPE
jgi:hypothetical protein